MKKRNILKWVTAFILISLTGCEGFLDKPIETQVPLVDIDYSDGSRMYEPVAGIYALANDNNLAHWADFCMMFFRSDFIIKGAHANDQPVMENIDNYNYEAMRDAWFVNNLWTHHYVIIMNANAALEELDKFGEFASDQNLVKQYKAEIRFFRALCYWRMARIYGDIPYYNIEVVAAALKRSPRSEIYDYIIREMQDCVNYLPAAHPNQLTNKGGVTKWAAYMLMAKAAADIQDYDIMLSASKAIFDSGLFSLYPDYYYLFKKQGQLCDENIFELQHTDFGAASGNVTNIDQYYVCHGIKQNGGKKFDGTSFVSGWGFSMPTQKYIDFMQDRGEGIRFETSIIYPNTATQDGDSIGNIPADLQTLLDRYNQDGPVAAEAYLFKGYLPFRQQTKGRYQYGGFNNIRIFRYADALLLYAEASVHINGAGAGDAPLNEVRERAGMTAISGATIDNILDERAAELEFEWGCDRFFDLIRLDKTDELGPNFIKGEDEFYPIPVVQIDLQPGLADPSVPGLIPN